MYSNFTEHLQSTINDIREPGDWWDEISDAEKESIAKGIEQADAGQLTPHSDAMASRKFLDLLKA